MQSCCFAEFTHGGRDVSVSFAPGFVLEDVAAQALHGLGYRGKNLLKNVGTLLPELKGRKALHELTVAGRAADEASASKQAGGGDAV